MHVLKLTAFQKLCLCDWLSSSWEGRVHPPSQGKHMSPTENLAASPRTRTWLHTALLPVNLHYLLPLHPHDCLATVWPIFAKSLVAVVVEMLFDSRYSSPPPTILSCCCTNSCYTFFLCYHPFRWLLVLSGPVYSTNSYAHCNMCTAWTHPGIV